MRGIIRVGDATSHGGKVETGSPTSKVMDRAVARLGDPCTCPIEGHENCVIAQGDPDFIVDDKPAAFDGHKTSCGARDSRAAMESCRRSAVISSSR